MTKPPDLPGCPNCRLLTLTFDTMLHRHYAQQRRHFVRCTACGARGTQDATRSMALARLNAGEWYTPFDAARFAKEHRATTVEP